MISLFNYFFYKNLVVTPMRRSLLYLYNLVIYTKKPTVCDKSFWLLFLQKSCSHTNEAELVVSIQSCNLYKEADCSVYVRSTKKEPKRLLELRIVGSMKKI